MTKVHGKRYAYKFDFQGLAASLQPQPDQSSFSFSPDYKHGMYRPDVHFTHSGGAPYPAIGHPGAGYPPHHQKHHYIPSPPTRSPSYQSHPGPVTGQYPWHPDIAGYPGVPTLHSAHSNQPLPPTSFYNWAARTRYKTFKLGPSSYPVTWTLPFISTNQVLVFPMHNHRHKTLFLWRHF